MANIKDNWINMDMSKDRLRTILKKTFFISFLDNDNDDVMMTEIISQILTLFTGFI